MLSDYRDIIKAPVITEKSANICENERCYVFKVDVKANKTQIKNEVAKQFGVKVLSVNTLNARQKSRRAGKYTGLTAAYKKAYVKLAEGSSIEY